jgi:hypothetical protein
MPTSRVTPFDLAFGPLAEARFPPIQAALAAARQDPRDRDAFLMIREVVELVRDLRPDEGQGDEIGELVAFLHHAYLFWVAGTPTFLATPGELAAVLRTPPQPSGSTADPPPAFYVQLPERRVWASVVPGEPAEPMDGCFLNSLEPELRVLGAFGVRPGRMGLSVVEVAGPRPRAHERADATPLFAPALPGGAQAGLASVIDGEELLELGWRLRGLAAERSQ